MSKAVLSLTFSVTYNFTLLQAKFGDYDENLKRGKDWVVLVLLVPILLAFYFLSIYTCIVIP